MHIALDEDVNASNAIQADLLVLVLPPVALAGHVFSPSVVLLVALSQDDVFVEGGGQSATFVAFNP